MTLRYHDYAPQIISAYKLKPEGTEHHGPCPNCGGEDRFRLQNYNGELRHHCRKGCPLLERTDAMRRDGLIPSFSSSDAAPYHERKGVPLLGAELKGSDVHIPLRDIVTDDEVGSQTIKPSGQKFFPKGMKKAGVGAFMGEPTSRIYVTEGWADAVVVHQATGMQVLFALDAGSLPKAVAALRQRCPDAEIIVVADNDADGQKAAQASGVPYCTPSQPGNDAWDVWNAGGNEAVVAMLDRVGTGNADGHDDLLADFNIVSGDQLAGLKFDPVEFLVPQVLPTPSLALLAGPPKAGKSWLAWRWALEVADGGRGVFYIAAEDSQRRIQSRLVALTRLTPANLRLVAAHDSRKPIPRGQEAVAFIRSVKSKFPDTALIVIDVAQAIMKVVAQEKGYAATSEEWGQLQRLAHELKVTILLVHHTKKTSGQELNSPLESVLGSTAIVGTAETIMVVLPITGSRDVKLHVTGKDVEKVDLFYPWQGQGFGSPSDGITANLGATQIAALDYIRQNPGCTQKEIVDTLGKDAGQISRAVSRLVELDKVSRSEERGLITK